MIQRLQQLVAQVGQRVHGMIDLGLSREPAATDAEAVASGGSSIWLRRSARAFTA